MSDRSCQSHRVRLAMASSLLLRNRQRRSGPSGTAFEPSVQLRSGIEGTSAVADAFTGSDHWATHISTSETPKAGGGGRARRLLRGRSVGSDRRREVRHQPRDGHAAPQTTRCSPGMRHRSSDPTFVSPTNRQES
jgi:hypothetical protein